MASFDEDSFDSTNSFDIASFDFDAVVEYIGSIVMTGYVRISTTFDAMAVPVKTIAGYLRQSNIFTGYIK